MVERCVALLQSSTVNLPRFCGRPRRRENAPGGVHGLAVTAPRPSERSRIRRAATGEALQN